MSTGDRHRCGGCGRQATPLLDDTSIPGKILEHHLCVNCGWSKLDDRVDVTCTGLAATWCPIHGDCSCPRDDIGQIDFSGLDGCLLHDVSSTHCDGDG